MGQVYRATDTKLKRQVAIKILPASLAADADRLARFQREAEVLASLNHPHIAAIYGLEESRRASTALVMELVEGDDLVAAHRARRDSARRSAADRETDRGRARSRARAGDHSSRSEAREHQGAAGRHGEGARLRPGESDGARRARRRRALSMSPTLTTPAMTQAGMILGTAAYMSPEQARGKTVDKRADIWAFGAVLYEMLTGTRAFGGEDVSTTLVDGRCSESRTWTRFRPTVPARVSQVLRVCLRKDPKQRVADIRDVRLALEGAFETVGPQTTTTVIGGGTEDGFGWPRSPSPPLVSIAMAVPALRYLRETPPPALAETRLDIVTPATDQPSVVCPVARRPADCLRRVGRRGVRACGCGRWRRRPRSRWRVPRARPSLLVARQPLDRLLRRKRAEAARSRRRRAADPRAGHLLVEAGRGTRTASSCLRRPR